MKRSIGFFLLTMAAFCGCVKLDFDKGTPKCIQKEIKDFDQSEACHDEAVDEYRFQGKTVYLFSSGNCGADMQSPIVDSARTILGALDGFVGNTQINGESFSHAVFVETVWTK